MTFGRRRAKPPRRSEGARTRARNHQTMEDERDERIDDNQEDEERRGPTSPGLRVMGVAISGPREIWLGMRWRRRGERYGGG